MSDELHIVSLHTVGSLLSVMATLNTKHTDGSSRSYGVTARDNATNNAIIVRVGNAGLRNMVDDVNSFIQLLY